MAFFIEYSILFMGKKSINTFWESLSILFAGLWLVMRIILEYFGFISDGNDRTTGIKDLRDEYKKANYK
jgi:preprotein translocase subunit SecG